MTLVRIDVIEGRRSPVQLEILADTVHSTIVEVVENTHADWSFTDDERDGNL
jgi:hypothetical protein